MATLHGGAADSFAQVLKWTMPSREGCGEACERAFDWELTRNDGWDFNVESCSGDYCSGYRGLQDVTVNGNQCMKWTS